MRESLIGNGWHDAESGAACDEVAPACHPGDEEDLNHQNEWLAGRFRCGLADSGASWRFERYVTRWCCTLLLYISRRSGYDAEASGLENKNDLENTALLSTFIHGIAWDTDSTVSIAFRRALPSRKRIAISSLP